MRKLPMLAACLLTCAAPARADQFVFSEVVTVPPDPTNQGGIFINLPAFDGSLGVVTAIGVDLAGHLNPGDAPLLGFDQQPLPTSVVLTPEVFLDAVSEPLSAETRPVVNGMVTGASPIMFDLQTTVDPSIGFLASPVVEIGAATLIASVGPGTFNTADLGDYASLVGTLTLTYTYTPVPEPASIVTLWTGLLGLIGFYRRRPHGWPKKRRPSD